MRNHLFACLAAVLLFSSTKLNAQDTFDSVRTRIISHLNTETAQDAILKNVISYLPQQLPDGSWSDINYGDSTIAQWIPIKHLDRVKSLSLAYYSNNGIYSGNPQVKTAIEKALEFWLKAKPKSANWWHNEIAVPQTIGEILLITQNGYTPLYNELSTALVNAMKKGDPFSKTGANKLDIALHYLYRACYTKDHALMKSAVDEVFQPIVFTTDEGLQYDYSYMQHKTQLQISSYGLVFLTGEYKVASWLQGTRYALKGEKLTLLDTYLTETFLKTIRGRYIDFNTEGRGLSRPDALDKFSLARKSNVNNLLNLAKQVNPENASVIDAAIDRITQNALPSYNVQPLHKHFWKGDYTIHLRKSYSFNVRTVSNRTVRTETGNKENLLGKFLADGSTNIQRSGNEYFNIMPVWEWDKIPGVTSRDYKQDVQNTIFWGEPGNTGFTGGASDGLYGCSVYQMDYNGVAMKKSWFFFDDQVVCLGAGISSSAEENITTTLNQCWLQGKAKYNAGAKTDDVKKSQDVKDPSWVWHDSIGYFFLQPANVKISTAKQTGSWSRVNASRSPNELEGNVFKLWIDHGAKPTDSSYAYSVAPGVDVNAMNMLAKEIQVIANNKKQQAVYNIKSDQLQVVMYEAGELVMNDLRITTNKPCVFMIKNVNANASLFIADPTQKLDNITFIIQSAKTNKSSKIECKLPQGNEVGSTAHFALSK